MTRGMAQFWVLLLQNARLSWRTPVALLAVVAQTIVYGVIYGFVWFQLPHTASGQLDRLGVLFIIYTSYVHVLAFTVSDAFIRERAAIVEQFQSQTCNLLAFYAAKVVIHLPIIAASAMLIAVPGYWLPAMRCCGEYFFTFFVILMCSGTVGIGVGLASSTWTDDFLVAAFLVPFPFSLFGLVAGYYVVLENLPSWTLWLQYLSPSRWCFEAMAINQLYDYNPINCTTNSDCFNGTQLLLDSFGISRQTPWFGVGIAFAIACSFILVGYAFFYLGMRKFKPRFAWIEKSPDSAKVV
jgi:ABC-type multidrug transport system permease subunit